MDRIFGIYKSRPRLMSSRNRIHRAQQPVEELMAVGPIAGRSGCLKSESNQVAENLLNLLWLESGAELRNDP